MALSARAILKNLETFKIEGDLPLIETTEPIQVIKQFFSQEATILNSKFMGPLAL